MEKSNERLKVVSRTDVLTSLGNRGALNQRLEHELYRARRYHVPLSLLMLDVDNFKLYNDSFGHPAGDTVLQKVAAILQGFARPSDFTARYGGEEFVVILPGTGSEGALAMAERLCQTVREAPFLHRPITVSIGVSTLRVGGQDADGLLCAADKALYQAKHSGRNRVAMLPHLPIPLPS